MERDLNGVQNLEKKVKQLELDLRKESDGRRKDKIIHDDEMKRLRSSVNLISGRSNESTRLSTARSNRGAGDTNNPRLAELEDSHKKEKKNNAKLKEVVQELKFQVEELADQRDDLERKNEKNQEMDTQSKRLRKRCDELRNRNEDLQHKVDDLEEEREQVKLGRIKEEKKFGDQLRYLEHKAVSSAAALKKEIEAHTETREYLKNAAKNVGSESSTADKSKIQNQQTEIRKLNQKERKQNTEIERLKMDLHELNEDYTAMSAEVQKNDQELKKSRTLGRKLKEQEEIVEQMTNEIESLRKNLEEKESMMLSLQKKLKEKANESVLSYERDEKECNICFEPFAGDRRAMVYFPCGHARTCQECHASLPKPKHCPECRCKIQKAALLFY